MDEMSKLPVSINTETAIRIITGSYDRILIAVLLAPRLLKIERVLNPASISKAVDNRCRKITKIKSPPNNNTANANHNETKCIIPRKACAAVSYTHLRAHETGRNL